MKRMIWSILLTMVIVAGLGIGFSTAVSAAPDTSWHPDFGHGAVFAMTNDVNGNAVVMFNRAADGSLNKVGSFSTGGTGGAIRSGLPIDALMSQGSLLLTDDGQWLLAVNAGSNDITVFKVKNNGLDLVEKVASGGVYPVSLTVSWNRVFVLNAGVGPTALSKTPNITGFKLGYNGDLDPIVGSTRVLPYPAGKYTQVGFNKWGNWLAVTDNSDGKILVYSIGLSGMPGANPAISASNGAGPFGFFFDLTDHLLVVEAGAGAVSSYNILPGGNLKVISGSVVNGQAAACWIAGRPLLGDFYTTNPGSGTISQYKDMVLGGKVNLVNATAEIGTHLLDEGISDNGQFLYGLDPINGAIAMYRIAFNGSLISLGEAGAGSLATYSQGIAVR